MSFSVPKGCTYGVIGRNGSGKSTLLKCVAGITRPTEGTVTVDGRISALIELGAGFHPEISGRENIFINGIMLGLTKKEIHAPLRRDRRVRRDGGLHRRAGEDLLVGHVHAPGLRGAMHVDPDVLLVDEVLAVGDQGFTLKCLDKFAEFRRRNKTILLVTHSLDLVEKFCDEALWLDKGTTKGEGDPKRVVAAYIDRRRRQPKRTSSRRRNRRASPRRRSAGDRDAGDAGPPRSADEPTAPRTRRRRAAPSDVQGH